MNRYRQHTKEWEGFDLSRSARLRSGSRRQIIALESILKDRLKKWRRYPGSDGGGHTEFFAMECWDEALALADELGVRGLGAHLSRGIDTAECLPSPKIKGMSEQQRQRLREMSAARFFCKRQEKAEWGRHITRELGIVLSIAQDYKDYLVWVDLTHWYELLAHGPERRRADKGLLDLYFGHFDPEFSDDEEAATGERRHTQASCAHWVKRLQWTAVTTHTSPLSKYRPEAMFHLRQPLVDPGDQLPHPVCAGTLLLRVQCGKFIPRQPHLAEFEAMVRQIESRRSLEQLAFNL